jgi:nucleoid-associated protein YgaU
MAALLVLAGGVGVAMVFHKPPPLSAVTTSAPEPIRHRLDDGPRFLMEVRSSAPFEPITPAVEPREESRGEPGRMIIGLPLFEAANESVPRIARHYPPAAQEALIPPPAETRHRVIDGDTLPDLAERYLGDAGRAGAILEANRDVLASPELLPIGAMLRIPARE